MKRVLSKGASKNEEKDNAEEQRVAEVRGE
jgi:hypothetical protein